MPTYAFLCADCEETTEAKLGFDEPQPTKCTKCGGLLKRQYGNLGVSFRGSGFYRTDSRKPDSKQDSPSTASSVSKPQGGEASSGSAAVS